jgi:hypothetical protein
MGRISRGIPTTFVIFRIIVRETEQLLNTKIRQPIQMAAAARLDI